MASKYDMTKLFLLGYSSIFLIKTVSSIIEVAKQCNWEKSKKFCFSLKDQFSTSRKNAKNILIHDSSAHFENFLSILPTMIKRAPNHPGILNKTIDISPKPKIISQNLGVETSVEPIQSNWDLDDVRGFDYAKQELETYISFFKEKRHSNKNKRSVPKGCILFGPPIFQRALLVRGLAGQANCPLFEVSDISPVGEIYCNGKWINTAEELFTSLNTYAPCILFVDNLDCYSKKNANVVQSFLREMDSRTVNEGVIILAAVHKLQNLPQHILNTGRFGNIIQVASELDFNSRKELFLLYLSAIQHDVSLDVDVLVKATQGMSAKEIKHLITRSTKKAAMQNRQRVSMQDICYMILISEFSHSVIPNLGLSTQHTTHRSEERMPKNLKNIPFNSNQAIIKTLNSFFEKKKCGKLLLNESHSKCNFSRRFA